MDKRFVLAVAALLSARAWAGDLPELQEVVVTASRAPLDLLQSPSFVTVISRKDIQESGADDLSGVLAAQSGVVINNYGPQGQLKTTSIRGSTSSQVLVLVDGIRLNSSFDGWVDLSRLPLDNVDRIEVVRGGASSLWGTGAVGGVINIITKTPDKPSFDLSITNESYLPHDSFAVTNLATGTSAFVPATPLSLLDGQHVALSLSGRLGEVGLSGGGSFGRAANAFVWDDSSNVGAWTGGWRQRNNAQDISQNAYAAAKAPFMDGSFTVKGTFDHSFIGVPGSLTYATSQASQEDTSVAGSVALTTPRFLSDALSLDVKGSYRWTQEILADPQNPPTSSHISNAAALELTQKAAVSDFLSAVYGGSAAYEAVDSTNLTGFKDRLSLAGFVSLPVSPAEPLTFTPSIRGDYYSDFPAALSWQLSAVLLLTRSASLKASFGSAYRVPTLSDLYWYDSFGDTGNPNLKPETSYSGELGAAFALDWLSLETSVFSRLVFNQIEWDPTAFPTMPINITQTLLPGAEIHATAMILEGLSLDVNYTFIYSLILRYLGASYTLADNFRVPFVPLHNLGVTGRLRTGIHTFSAEVRYESSKFTDAANTPAKALAAYAVVNAGYRAAVTENLVFSLALRNILNAMYFTQSGYPMPPFSVITGMEVRL
ncbi:MAG TPA: TonB-dependent receptor [Spirochaetia bacterium]|nr:TonB-dependent receptor [Spirochaetia bacterium]